MEKEIDGLYTIITYDNGTVEKFLTPDAEKEKVPDTVVGGLNITELERSEFGKALLKIIKILEGK